MMVTESMIELEIIEDTTVAEAEEEVEEVAMNMITMGMKKIGMAKRRKSQR